MAEVGRYAIKDSKGLVVNVVLWDGNTETWEPDKGFTAHRLDPASKVGPGDIVDAQLRVTKKYEPTKDVKPGV